MKDGRAVALLPIKEGEIHWLVLRYDDDDVHPVDRYDSARKLEVTAAYWRVWASQLRYTGPYHAQVERSALALKLLTDGETGGIIAAPTTSLPEVLGGVSQLGLPLRLAEGRRLHPRRARRRGTSRGSRSLHALPQAGLPPRIGPASPDHVRTGWTAELPSARSIT